MRYENKNKKNTNCSVAGNVSYDIVFAKGKIVVIFTRLVWYAMCVLIECFLQFFSFIYLNIRLIYVKFLFNKQIKKVEFQNLSLAQCFKKQNIKQFEAR